MGSAPSALEGPSGNRETFLWLAEGARAGAVRRSGLVTRASVVTHRRPGRHDEAVRTLMEVARGRRVTL